MKRWLRRMVAVTFGLMLGWFAAGQWSPLDLWAQSPAGHVTGASHESGSSINSQTNAAHHAVVELVPAHGSTPWLRSIIIGIAAVFVAAIVIGTVSRKLGLRDANLVAIEQDQKSAHEKADVSHH